MSRPEIRPLLPQTTPMTNFSFAPPNLGVGDTKKNYVFVDEHNRHKRLKVMRACEGCRKRKIKCDAATTNSWPCAACVRLKLNCVPPTVHYNHGAHAGMQATPGFERVLDFADSSGDSAEDDGADEGAYEDVYGPPSAKRHAHARPGPLSTSSVGYDPSLAAFHASAPQQRSAIMYDALPTPTMPPSEASYYAHPSFHSQTSLSEPPRTTESAEPWPREDFSVADLQEVMGSLKVHDNGTAPYIVLQKKTLAEAPALEEAEVFSLPSMIPDADSRVRIPPDLMPNHEQAMEYFDVFFRNVHPYIPVISKMYFYRQWRTNRSLISPLLLEAVFAAAGRYSNDPTQGLQWLAMASKHENNFMDVPRLSTIQALLILLKAREANPKRGYYYRSWMTLKTACTMAKDLELDEHYAAHQARRTCADPTECQVKTRIWQAVFCGEIFIGGPQGRRDMSASADTVDFSIPPTPPGGDDEDTRVWRQYVYLARACRNVRSLADTYGELMKDKNWASHPRLQALNPEFPQWMSELPPDMQIHYPEDGSVPWLQSHVVGSIHCYYHLGILLLHRPQLMASSFSTSTSWKEHMTISYDSAKKICRIQESLLQNFDIQGLMYMQRGINFAIYCILTCTMLHLAAITVPDPAYNADAKEYFTRHMRILESCMAVNPMDDTRAQIESLREAFSADVRKPFELKPSFPYGSPIASFAPSPPADVSHFRDPIAVPQSSSAHTAAPAPASAHFDFTSLTPPISAGLDDVKDGPLAVTSSMPMMPSTGQDSFSGGHLEDECVSWNPTRLFHQWHTAFGTPTSVAASNSTSAPPHPHSPTLYSSSASNVSHDLPGGGHTVPDTTAQFGLPITLGPAAATPSPSTAGYAPSMPPQQPPPALQPQPQPQFVSPAQWQAAVASTYVPRDLKRRWDGVGGPSWNGAGDSQQQQMLYI